MAACLPSEKDQLDLDSLHTHSAESSNGKTSSSHRPGHEHILDTAPVDKPYNSGIVHDQEPEPDTQDDDFVFTDDELVELELLRDQEIGNLVDAGLLSKEDRWNAECRQGFTLSFPEMTIRIFTGGLYPVKALRYEVKNISLPRVVVDQLRVALRIIHKIDARANTFKRWSERDSSESGCFEFEMGALHIAAKATDHLEHYRKDPTYWRNQTTLQQTDYKLSLERRKHLRDIYGYYDLVPDESDEEDGGKKKQRYDPFNTEWSKKLTDLTDEQKLNFSNVQEKTAIMDSMFGIDPKSIQGHDLANSIIGKSPVDVCAKIPEIFRILHIESVIRSDLAARFFRRQARIRDDLGKLHLNILKGSVKRETRLEMGKRANEAQTLIDHLVSPDLTFHCTREDQVPSIVRQGFLKPDEKNVRCGSTYGRGIYSSPDPTFALMYTQFRPSPTKSNEFASLKLIACATLTGICRYMLRDDNWRHQDAPYPGAHCHAANDLLEYVVFDNAQIIPCYVIHLDLGRDAASYISKLARNPTDYINEYREQRRKAEYAVRKLHGVPFGPGDEKRRKEALLAKARKYFPYGFGAASGSHFVVEAVGDVSEDEEHWGRYQKDRVDNAGDDATNDIWTNDDGGNFALDGEGYLDDDDDDDEEKDSNGDDGDGEGGKKGEDGDGGVAWEYELGPKGRTHFDEFYEARKAKSGKRKGAVGRCERG